jgi:hypothetical protein
MLPAILAIESQAIISIFDMKKYKRFKKQILALVQETGNNEFADRFTLLFNYYEEKWNKAISQAKSGRAGNYPWDEVSGAFCELLNIGFVRRNEDTIVNPIAITTISSTLLMARQPPFWKFIEEHYEVT